MLTASLVFVDRSALHLFLDRGGATMVSGHSGLPENVELRLLEEKYKAQKEKREKQLSIVCGVLDKMPKEERRKFLSLIIKKYFVAETVQK